MLNQVTSSNGAVTGQDLDIPPRVPNEPELHSRFTLRDFLLVLFKYKGVAVGCFVATVLGTLGWLWVRSDSYETSATIVIKFSREAADPETSLSPNTTRVLPATRPDINTEAELIKSYALINDVVSVLHLDAPPPDIPPPGLLPRIKFELKGIYHWAQSALETIQTRAGLTEPLTLKEKVIVRLIRGLKVETVKDSSVVKVTLSSPIKQHAGEVVNTLIEQYRKRRMSVQTISGKTEFFDREATTYKDRLHTAEERLNALKEQFNISSMPEQINLLLTNLSDADRVARETQDQVDAAQAKIVLLRTQLKELSPNLMTSQIDSRNTQLDELAKKKVELELERQRLSAKYDDKSVLLQDLDSEIKRVDQLLAGTQTTVQQSRTTSVNSNYVDLEKELLATTQLLASERARLSGEQKSVEDYQQQLERLRTAEIAFNQLSRDVALNDETYRLHQRNATEATVSDALNSQGISGIEVVDPAVDPILASGIRKSYLFGGAIAIGLLLGVGLAFLFEALDRTADSTEDVENHLGRPLWGSLSLVSKAKSPAQVIAHDIDEFSALAARLENSATGPGPHVFLLQSASEKAGVTTATVGLGRAFERSGQRTLIIDPESDPVLNALKCGSNGVGRDLDLPGGNRAKLWEISPDLSAITFPSSTSHHSQITAEDMDTVIARLPGYLFVLVDAGLFVHRRLVSQFSHASGGILVVAEWQKTRREVLDRLREECRQENVKVVAGILNKRRYLIPDFIYKKL